MQQIKPLRQQILLHVLAKKPYYGAMPKTLPESSPKSSMASPAGPEKISRSGLQTTAQLRAMPKVELHRHLDCSMRLSTFRELAPLCGLELPSSDEAFKKAFLVLEPMNDLEAVLKKFLASQVVLHSEEILTRLTFEAIEDAVQEGIKIVEFRYAPTFILDGHSALTLEKIHSSILRGVALAQAQNLPIAVGLICILQRILPVEICREVTDFAIENKKSFVGIDLADNETAADNRKFESLFQDAKSAGLHITVHSGESNVPQAPDFVLNAIHHLGAERIGHGLQIFRSTKVMDEVKRLKIPLELCPTSNWLTNAISAKESHPIRKLMEYGVPITINTDDPGIFHLDLVHEYALLQDRYDFTPEEFTRCNDTAAAASFLPLDVKQKYWPRKIHPL